MLTSKFTGKQILRISACFAVFVGIVNYSDFNSKQGLFYLLFWVGLGVIFFALSFSQKVVKKFYPHEVGARLSSLQKWERVIGLIMIIFAALDLLFLKKIIPDIDWPILVLGMYFFEIL